MTLPGSMYAAMLDAAGSSLVYRQVPLPQPLPQQVLVKVIACGVCRTDLHIVDGELTQPKLPLIPGHEIIGEVVQAGAQAGRLKVGTLVGIPWLGYTCGTCTYCLRGQENLCENAKFTGYTLDGGYAQYTVANEQYCFPLPPAFHDPAKAPLLCAGLIGYRSYSMIGPHVKHLGLYGFGAAAHILIQVARHEGKNSYAFTRDGDTATQEFARKLGAVWAGGSSESSPVKLDAAIIFAPAGELVPQALRNMDKGGTVVCGGIHMSDIPSFPYDILWEERSIRSVANLTRQDATAFLKIAAETDIHTTTTLYPLSKANEALHDLRSGNIHGAAVLVMD